MKSFSPTSGIFLASLFSKLSLAIITIDALPISLKSGVIYNIGWSSDRDYHIEDFSLYHLGHGDKYPSRVSVVDHYLNVSAGNDSTLWKAPAVKDDGLYEFSISAAEFDENGHIDLHATTYTSSTAFEIYGGPVLYPGEIVGVVFGSMAALALIIGASVFGTRHVLKKRWRGVRLGEVERERYRDDVAEVGR